MEIWEPKPPGNLWATPGLLWDSFLHLEIQKQVASAQTLPILSLKNHQKISPSAALEADKALLY
jgi:hypothetical protein